jgi:hypothetical protein
MTIWRMSIACWIPKATNTHTGYVILIAFPHQQWLHESASTLRFDIIKYPKNVIIIIIIIITTTTTTTMV